MNLITFHQDEFSKQVSESFRIVLTDRLLSKVFIEAFGRDHVFSQCGENFCVTLDSAIDYGDAGGFYVNSGNGRIKCPLDKFEQDGQWSVITNGFSISDIDREWLFNEVVLGSESDAAAVYIDEELGAYTEVVRVGESDEVAGIRRNYTDSAFYISERQFWPEHLFIRNEILRELVDENQSLPGDFAEFKQLFASSKGELSFIKAAGRVNDLRDRRELSEFMLGSLEGVSLENGQAVIAKDARVIGTVVFGDNVSIGSEAIVSGPGIICDNVNIGAGSVVQSSIISSSVNVADKSRVRGEFMGQGGDFDEHVIDCRRVGWIKGVGKGRSVFRKWKRFSYPVFFKRIFDIAVSSIFLLLSAPVFLIIAVAVKVSSPGPVFYRARRQGQYGKEFDCLKFRSMMVSAEAMQQKLRAVNQVDGPQFKMENDPRISKLGRFLRDTSIDEIPQFINVFLGQMSVVGPRPSPEAENSLCPYWRDGRLSARPGITGLWQICRTRAPSRDFQEWVKYDTDYVRNLSFKMDIWICWRTAVKLINDFVNQF